LEEQDETALHEENVKYVKLKSFFFCIASTSLSIVDSQNHQPSEGEDLFYATKLNVGFIAIGVPTKCRILH
jgi:hypothetical protein